jgi:hypothetical protein
MHPKEENLKTENHTTLIHTVVSEIYTKQSINEENSSLFMNSIVEKSDKYQDYAQKHQRNFPFINSLSGLSFQCENSTPVNNFASKSYGLHCSVSEKNACI